MTISWQDADDPEEFQPQERYVLALELLGNLPNLQSIDIDLPSSRSFTLNSPNRTLESDIANRGHCLTGLTLTNDTADEPLCPGVIASLLQQLPKIQQLELCGVARQSSDGPVLRDVIAAIENLYCLDFDDTMCLVDDWANADWKCDLVHLALDE